MSQGIQMTGLPDDLATELLLRRADLTGTLCDDAVLERLTVELVATCSGVPLLLEVTGGALRGGTTREDWEVRPDG
jgi:hypothetical protein